MLLGAWCGLRGIDYERDCLGIMAGTTQGIYDFICFKAPGRLGSGRGARVLGFRSGPAAC